MLQDTAMFILILLVEILTVRKQICIYTMYVIAHFDWCSNNKTNLTRLANQSKENT